MSENDSTGVVRRTLAGRDLNNAVEPKADQGNAARKKPSDDRDQSLKAVVRDRKVLESPTAFYDGGATGATGRHRINDVAAHRVYTQPYPVLLAILFGVEASYLAAWSALLPSGPYAEFIERWSSADFVTYVAVLGGLAERHPHEAAQGHFNEVLVHEREFWKMSWES